MRRRDKFSSKFPNYELWDQSWKLSLDALQLNLEQKAALERVRQQEQEALARAVQEQRQRIGEKISGNYTYQYGPSMQQCNLGGSSLSANNISVSWVMGDDGWLRQPYTQRKIRPGDFPCTAPEGSSESHTQWLRRRVEDVCAVGRMIS